MSQLIDEESRKASNTGPTAPSARSGSESPRSAPAAPGPPPAGIASIPPKTRLEQGLSVVTLGLLLIGCFVVMRPFLSALMWAVVLGFTLWPVQSRLTRWLGNRRTLAASVTTLTIAIVLVVPFVVVGISVADDGRALAAATRKWSEGGLPAPPAWVERIPIIGNQAKSYWEEFDKDLEAFWLQLREPLDEEPGFIAEEGDVELLPGASPVPSAASGNRDWPTRCATCLPGPSPGSRAPDWRSAGA